LVGVVVVLGWGGAEAGEAEAWGAGVRVVARVAVPSRVLKVGEVRLVSGSNVVSVQTVLWSRHLKTAATRIAEKESRNWPEGTVGAEAAEEYRVVLLRLADAAMAEGRESENRPALLVDYVATPDGDWVRLSKPRVEEGADGWEVVDAQPIEVLEGRGDYVRRNQEKIVDDVFGKEAGAVRAELEALRGFDRSAASVVSDSFVDS
jgi:hypothetical protein